MTTPPEGEHEPGPAGRPADGRAGAWPDDDPNATRPAPAWEPPRPGPGSEYGPSQPPFYGPPATGQPIYGPPGYAGRPPYAPPGPAYGPPPYGQPAPYGHQPYGGPPRKSRAGLIAAVVGVVLLLGAAAVALLLALQITVLDRTAVERDVAAQFEEREGVAVDLSCADEMLVHEGATYECSGTTDQGEDVTLRIAITDEQVARYTWAPEE